MANVSSKKSKSASVSADSTRKQRKKQAKYEAQTMLRVERAKRRVQKAERGLAKAQGRLEARHTRLSTLEAKLSKLRHADQQPADSTVDAAANGHRAEVTHAQSNTMAREAALPAAQESLSVEGDVAEEQEQAHVHPAADESAQAPQVLAPLVMESVASDAPAEQQPGEAPEVAAPAQGEQGDSAVAEHGGDAPEVTSTNVPGGRRTARRRNEEGE